MPCVDRLSLELYDSALHRDLVGPALTNEDGLMVLPLRSGPGMGLNEEVVNLYLPRDPVGILA